MTDTIQTTNGLAPVAEQGTWRETMEFRLSKVDEASVGADVVVEQVRDHEALGMVGDTFTLLKVDRTDNRLTYLVGWDRGRDYDDIGYSPGEDGRGLPLAQWVHRVRQATERVDESLTRAPAEVIELRGKVTDLERRLTEERGLRLNANRALDRLKERVRDKAMEIRSDHDWCLPGVNEVLRSLDIDPVRTRMEATLIVEVKVSFMIPEDEDPEDVTRAAAREHFSVDSDGQCSDDGTYDEVDFESADIVELRDLQEV